MQYLHKMCLCLKCLIALLLDALVFVFFFFVFFSSVYEIRQPGFIVLLNACDEIVSRDFTSYIIRLYEMSLLLDWLTSVFSLWPEKIH